MFNVWFPKKPTVSTDNKNLEAGDGSSEVVSSNQPYKNGQEEAGEDLNVMDGELRKYLELQDFLNEVGLAEELEVPAVVVIGGQSAGKSAVLELLSQITLPKATNIATRCPIHITMLRDKHSSIDIKYKDSEGADHNHRNIAPGDVENKLRNAQSEKLREGEKICSEPIQLNVCGPQVPNLSIVDLPGLNYTDKNLKTEIIKLIYNWIVKPNTVIVVVFPCNCDIASTEAIELAENVDPKLDRSLCVLTKPDLALEKQVQQDVIELASNQHESVRFKKGFVVVRGKGADDCGLTIQQTREREKKFFENHPKFSDLYRDNKAGTDSLIKLVSKVIHEMAQKNLPALLGKIDRMHREALAEKSKLPITLEGDRFPLMAEIIDKIRKHVRELSVEEVSSDKWKECHLQCQNTAEYEKFSQKVMETLKEDIEEIYEKLRHEYEHHRGTEPRGFSRNYLYKNHVKNKMAQLREVAFETLSRVAQLVEKSLEAVLEKDANKFSLLEPITAEVKAVFEMQKADCEQFLRTTFKMEKMPFICDYNLAKVPVEVTMAQEQRCLFTQYNLSTVSMGEYSLTVDEKSRDDWKSQTKSPEKSTKQRNKSCAPTSSRFPSVNYPPEKTHYVEKIEGYVEDSVKKTWETYCKYVYHCCCTIMDTVPKAIEYHLVTNLNKKLRQRLMARIAHLVACMKEDEELKMKREEINARVAKLERVIERCRHFDNKQWEWEAKY